MNDGDSGKCGQIPLVWGEFCAYERDVMQRRFDDLKIIYDNMQKEYFEVGYAPFVDHKGTLKEICFTYMNDLKRDRHFHDLVGGCDRNHRAAYLARLVALHRPIRIGDRVRPDIDETYYAINAHYAFHVFSHFLLVDPELFDLDAMKAIQRDLVFTFTHRDPQPETLVCVARGLNALNQQHAVNRASDVGGEPSSAPLPPSPVPVSESPPI